MRQKAFCEKKINAQISKLNSFIMGHLRAFSKFMSILIPHERKRVRSIFKHICSLLLTTPDEHFDAPNSHPLPLPFLVNRTQVCLGGNVISPKRR